MSVILEITTEHQTMLDTVVRLFVQELTSTLGTIFVLVNLLSLAEPWF